MIHHRQVIRRALTSWALLVLAAQAAASPPDQPDAVVVFEPTSQQLFSLAPLVTQYDRPLLMHTPGNEPYLSEYLNQIDAKRVWLIDPKRRLPDRLRAKFDAWQGAPAPVGADVARQGWTNPSAVVLFDSRSPELAVPACLVATARKVPAVWLDGAPDAELRDWLRRIAPAEILFVGEQQTWFRNEDVPKSRLVRLKTPADTLAAYEAALNVTLIEHLVVVSAREPAEPRMRDLALLVPSFAVKRRAAVAILEESANTTTQIERIVTERYPAVRYVTLWGNAESLPDVDVDDPVAAAGLETKLTEKKIAVAPLAGLDRRRPCQFRVGRITGDSVSSISLLVARNLHRPVLRPGAAPTALVLANADYELPLMETITRTTVQTIEQSGWPTRALYGWRTGWYERPNRLWGADLVLYEGHTYSLTHSAKFDAEREPVFPGLYVFQGCKTLRQPEVLVLLRNGAAGVMGTTTNTYSASGSALAKTYVDAMLLHEMDAGTSLMVARNFMLALADLKERRGHEQAPKILRGGLTFSLWGDPTWRPPPSPNRVPDDQRVHTTRKGNQIELHVPDSFARAVEAEDYVAQIPFGAKLAGMYEWENEERVRRQLPPLFFVIVPLLDFDGDAAPTITSPVARNRWTTLWDSRNRWLYLLVQSSSRQDFDRGRKLVFHVGRSE